MIEKDREEQVFFMAKNEIKIPRSTHPASGRYFFNPSPKALELPNLTEIQTNSFEWFIGDGLRDLFNEVFPIEDFTGKIYKLEMKDYWLGEAKYSEKTAKLKKVSHEAPLKANFELTNKETNKKKIQEVFLGDIPVMTDRGTFIINGVERVVISQLIRSAGVFFNSDYNAGRELFGAKVIPGRGAWLEIETSAQDVIYAKIDRKRKIPITTMIRALGYESNEKIIELFRDVNTNKDRDYIKNTLEKDPSTNCGEAFVEVYKRIRPGDLATVENAQSFVEGLFFDIKKYDLSRVGRYKLNKRLKIDVPNKKENHILRREDFIEIFREIIKLNNGHGVADDIDNLGNRRVKTVGELLQQKYRMGLLRTERIIRDRMSTSELEVISPSQLVNVRPIVAAVREFFASSQLSQFMDQTNTLSEMAHKRRLSSLGPGGLTRERAGFEVRDVHRTHYGRICPIETPEGPNIGLVNSFASYARLNEFGFIETPYRKVKGKVDNDGQSPIGEINCREIKDKNGRVLIKKGEKITAQKAKEVAKTDEPFIYVKPKVTGEIVYLTADEENCIIAQAKTEIDNQGYFVTEFAIARKNGEADEVPVEEIDFMDVATEQPVGVSASLIPFIEHDDARRSLMGANMQRQAVSLIRPQSPIVGTGNELKVAEDSGHLVKAKNNGVILSVSGSEIVIKYDKGGEETIGLNKFEQSNSNTCINQKPVVYKGDKIKKGQLLVDGPAMQSGELALGQNVLVAFMCMEGGTYEDAIIISEKLAKDDVYSSIHLEEVHLDVRDTKLGEEVITRDIPNVGEEALRDLDEEGIIRVGAEVTAGDILVGKITPKGETELTAEERLLRAIFGEKARDVKDSSLRVEPGMHGKIVNINIKSRKKGDELPVGVIKQIFVTIAQMRKIAVGDKMAGRHGNKGVIAKILPVEDMPYLEDGTPIDIILNPQGVISRMNFGQVLETHLGWAAGTLGIKVATPVFDGVNISQIKSLLKEAGLPEDGRSQLYDGRTGEPFAEKTVVGYSYMLKLLHLVEDKIHARSIGPYAMVTQQPLGGKAQFGGQRLGEMEVWALEAYGAAHTLQEMLTIKSDDVVGRSKAYESVIKDEEIREPRVPESFNVLVKELQGLGLAVDLIQEEKGQKKEIEAEEIIEETYQENIEELKEADLMVGSEAEKSLPAIDVTTEEAKDSFKVLEESEN